MMQVLTGSRVLVATGLAASALTLLGPSASPAAGTAETAVAYGGFAGEGWSTPVRVELYEPSVPVPASPQAEFELAYSKVEADSGTAHGRASYLWPGDTIGEGMRTFAGLLGLPVDNPVTGPGYRLQVNSQYPGKPATQKDEPLPGMVMRTTSGDKRAVAETGFSPDGAVLGPDAGEDGDAGDSSPLGGLLSALGSPANGLGGGVGESGSEAPSIPGLPPELAALVDVDGLVAVSRISAVDGPVTTATRSALGEVRLLGGLLTVDGMETVARATTDGAKGVATGRAQWGKLTLAGQEFSVGPDGAVVAGQKNDIPGLDMQPAEALKALGITFEIPEPVRTEEGDLATSVSEGLRIIIETETLSPLLAAIPAGELSELIPAEAGPVKGIVAGLSTLAPKLVITLGLASATVDTVPPMDPPPPPAEPEVVPPESGSSGAPATGGSTDTAGGAPPAPAPAPAPADPGITDAGPNLDASPASADPGLPSLYSFPGLLLVGAIAAVGVTGAWMRRLGALSLGAGASCSHGLDSGVPDLRKV